MYFPREENVHPGQEVGKHSQTHTYRPCPESQLLRDPASFSVLVWALGKRLVALPSNLNRSGILAPYQSRMVRPAGMLQQYRLHAKAIVWQG